MNKEEQLKNIRYFNFMTSRQLNFNEGDIVLARQAILQLWISRLGKSLFIPTPAI
jgi:hypothetical protein